MKVFTAILLLTCSLAYGQDFDLHSNVIDPDVTFSEPNEVLSTDPFEDSLFQVFRKSMVNFELSNSLLNKEEGIVGLEFRQKTKPLNLSGVVNVGYEYGLLTGYIDPISINPLSVFNTRGDISVDAAGLPVNISYNYSTLINPLGVNNYFRCSLDTEKLKQKGLAKKNEAIGEIDRQINDLQRNKGVIQGKLGMGEVLLQKYKRELGQYINEIDQIENQIKKEEEKQSFDDDIGLEGLTKQQKIDSLELLQKQVQQKQQRAAAIYDTVNKIYNDALILYELYSDFANELSDKKTVLSGLSGETIKNKSLNEINSRKNGFVSSIKTLDLGLTYPKITGLSKNSVPIQGVNLEFQKEKWYMAFTSGVTMNNLMVSTDAIQNKLNNTSNLFNQFDFQNIKQRGWLTNIKTGFGRPDETHVYIGVRYLTNSIPLQGNTDSSAIPSLGNELDIRWIPKFSKSTSIDFIYGKTSWRSALIDSSRSGVLNSLYSSDRTNTSLFSITQNLKFIRSTIQGIIRWIDPYADVRSLGTLQPDNLRYEIKSTTIVTQGMRLGMNYRHDQNNLLSVKDTSVELNVLGGQLNGNLFKNLSYFTSLNYLTQYQNSSAGRITKNNYMFGFGISSSYTLGKVKNTLSISYNDYLITDTVSTGLFRNIALQNATKFNFGVNKISISYFQMVDDLLLNNTSFIIGDEFSAQKMKLKITLGIKLSISDKYGIQPGGKLETSYKINNHLEWSFRAERMVLGDFYNYYSRERYDRFPYAISTRLGWIF
ncbi:MAG: hypothetical protein EP305_04475 [Bacteroidetes bacterium]|nr:MAG: hypothetical protein EP305_04475 [Bacteroidota bacterium]